MALRRATARAVPRWYRPTLNRLNSSFSAEAEWSSASTPSTSSTVSSWRKPSSTGHTSGEFAGAEVDEQIVGTTVVDPAKADRIALLLRMSRLIEDDPNIAKQFVGHLRLPAGKVENLVSVCQKGEKADICPPSKAQLHQVGLASALPFLGFGILDNAIMIIFGDFLDITFCSTFGFSTMAAAALGNTISDGFGVFSGGAVEDMAYKAGFEAPPLSRAQQALAVTKRHERLGQLFGITIGCLIGMFPLMFINWEGQEAVKREKTLEHMYEHVVVAVEEMLGAEAAMICVVDEDVGELHSRSAAHHGTEEFEVRMKIGQGILGRVAQSGQFVNVADLRAPEGREYYDPDIHDNFRGTGIKVRSMLCMPVLSYCKESGHCDKVVGVVGVINKKGGPFTEWDEDALAALCSHISTSLSFVHGEEHGFDEALERCSRALKTRGTRINSAANQRVHELYAQVLVEVCRIVQVDEAELLSVNNAHRDLTKLASSKDERRTSDFSADDEGNFQCSVASEAVVNNAPAMSSTTFCYPVTDASERVIGIIRTTCGEEKIFTEEEQEVIKSVTQRVALTMEGTGSSLTRFLRNLQEETDIE